MQTWKHSEKAFEAAFDKYGKAAFVCRLPDTAQVKRLAGPKAFIPPQPSDYILTLNGEMMYAEVKSTKDADAFHFSNIQKGQMAASRRQVAAGGVYLFFIHSLARAQWFCVPAELIHATMATKKHLTWDELAPFPWDPDSGL